MGVVAVRPATSIDAGMPSNRARPRVFVCDGDPSTRFRISQRLQDRRMLIAGSAGRLTMALAAIRATQPDVVVFDDAVLSDSVPRVRAGAPRAKVVVYAPGAERLPARAATAGPAVLADAYVGIDKPVDELCDVIDALCGS